MNTTEITTSNETSAFNQNNSIYFIEPQTDPELIDCHGFELKTELQVHTWYFSRLFVFFNVKFSLSITYFTASVSMEILDYWSGVSHCHSFRLHWKFDCNFIITKTQNVYGFQSVVDCFMYF